MTRCIFGSTFPDAEPSVSDRRASAADVRSGSHPGRLSSISDAMRCWLSGWGTSRVFEFPGAWDDFELAVRAVLGQQISVKGASTLAGRIAQRFGTPFSAGFLFPTRRLWRQRRSRSAERDSMRALKRSGNCGTCGKSECSDRLRGESDPGLREYIADAGVR